MPAAAATTKTSRYGTLLHRSLPRSGPPGPQARSGCPSGPVPSHPVSRPSRVIVYVAAAAALAAAAAFPLPYYAVGPGPVREVTPLIRFDGMERYQPSGTIVPPTVR